MPLDPVRVELACALRLGIPVIPVCVDGAAMPAAADLDAEIADLLEFTAADLSDARWAYDVQRLIAAIDSVGGTASSPTPPATAAAEYVIHIEAVHRGWGPAGRSSRSIPTVARRRCLAARRWPWPPTR